MSYNTYENKFGSVVKCAVGCKRDNDLSKDPNWKCIGAGEWND